MSGTIRCMRFSLNDPVIIASNYHDTLPCYIKSSKPFIGSGNTLTGERITPS
jgi:hypothetical protein